MIQQAIILVLFLAAAGYIGTRIFKAFAAKGDGGCAKGCGCDTGKSTV